MKTLRIGIPLITLIFMGVFFQGCDLFSSSKSNQQISGNGYYFIHTPNAATRAKLDSTIEIRWTLGAAISDPSVKIELFQGEELVQVISSNTPNDGSLSWRVSSANGSGTEYQIRITSLSDSTQTDISSNFSITSNFSGSYTINSPSAGFDALLDSALTINWSSIGNPGSNVQIMLYKDTVFVLNITSSTGNDGAHVWARVTSSLGSGDDYRIKVQSSSDPGISAFSPNFSISSAFDGSFTFTWPTQTDSVLVGSSQSIEWTSSGTPGTTVALTLWKDSVQVSTITTSTTNDGAYPWIIPVGLTSSNRYQIRIASLQDAGINDLSEYFTIAGIDDDDHEPDSIQSLATVVNFGIVQNHSLTQNDIDWLEIQVDSGKSYIISNTGINIYKRIYEPGGTSYIQSFNYTSPSIWIAPTTGTYYIQITPYGSSYGDYTISVTPMDSITSPFIQPSLDTTLQSGSSFSITWTPDSTFFGTNVRLYLFQDSTQMATITTLTQNNGQMTWTIPDGYESGYYKIQMRNYSNSNFVAFSDSFFIDGVDPDSFEVDDSLAIAKSISIDGSIQNRTISNLDEDWIQFPAEQGKSYLISVTGDTRVRLYVRDSDETQYEYSTSINPLIVFDAPSTETFYLHIQYYSSTYFGDYNVSVLALDSNAQNLIQVTSPDSSSTWATGSSYSITWVNDSAFLGTNVSINLYKDTTLVRSIITATANDGNQAWTAVNGLMTGSDYRIRIANYSIPEIFGYSAPFTISGVSPDLLEPDNTRDSAVTVSADGTLYNRSLSLADQDWMAFSVEAGKNYQIKTQGNLSFGLTLYKDSSVSALKTSTTTNPTLTLGDAETGTYYLRATGSSYGDYQISFTEFSPESLLVFANPNAQTTWSAGSNYSIQWAPDSGLFPTTVYLYLYKGNRQLLSLGTSTYLSGTRTWTIPTGLASGSDYQIRLQNSTADFYALSPTFTISGLPADGFEPNDSVSLATSIVTDGSLQAHNLTYQDLDWFTFTGTANTVYEIKSQQATTLRSTTALYSSQGTSLIRTSTQSTSDSVNSIVWFCPTNGEYHFRISSTQTGDYQISVTAHSQTDYQFSFTAPVLGDTVTRGTPYTIQWNSLVDLGGTADIFLYNSAGIVQTIQATAQNTGSYNWNVPTTLTPASDYYIRIISLISSEINGNSEVFTIN